MNEQQIKDWIQNNLVMKSEAMKITGQSSTAFDQSVATSRIQSFVEFGDKRPTKLYLRSELEHYAFIKKGTKPLKTHVLFSSSSYSPVEKITEEHPLFGKLEQISKAENDEHLSFAHYYARLTDDYDIPYYVYIATTNKGF